MARGLARTHGDAHFAAGSVGASPINPARTATGRIHQIRNHTSAHIGLADKVHRWLIEDGHRPFLDHTRKDGKVPGEHWEDLLEQGTEEGRRARHRDAGVSELVWCAAVSQHRAIRHERT